MIQRKNLVQSTVQNQELNLEFSSKKQTGQQSQQFLCTAQNSQSASRTTILDELSSKWTQEQLENLITLYEMHGPAWTYIASKLLTKSEKQVKNKYNNSLKRIAKILNKLEGKIYKNTKKSITEKLLKTMIDFVNMLEKSIRDYELTPNYDCKFLYFRNQILRYSFSTQNNFEEAQLNDFIRMIKGLNSKIKCYGIFKNSSQKKDLKIQMRALVSISQFDKITIQEKSDLIMKLETQYKQKGNKKMDQCFTYLNYEQRSQTNIRLIQIQSYNNTYQNEQGDLQRQYYDIIGESDPYVYEKHFLLE